MGAVAFGKRDEPGPVEVDTIVVHQVRVLVQVPAARAKPDLPLFFVRSMDEVLEATLMYHKLFSLTFIVFGGMALLLALKGGFLQFQPFLAQLLV